MACGNLALSSSSTVNLRLCLADTLSLKSPSTARQSAYRVAKQRTVITDSSLISNIVDRRNDKRVGFPIPAGGPSATDPYYRLHRYICHYSSFTLLGHLRRTVRSTSKHANHHTATRERLSRREEKPPITSPDQGARSLDYERGRPLNRAGRTGVSLVGAKKKKLIATRRIGAG